MTKQEKLQRVALVLFGGLSNPYDWLKHGENELERYSFGFLTEGREDVKIEDLETVKEKAKELMTFVEHFISKVEEAQSFINEAED